jgi:hypothetical protein
MSVHAASCSCGTLVWFYSVYIRVYTASCACQPSSIFYYHVCAAYACSTDTVDTLVLARRLYSVVSNAAAASHDQLILAV